MNYHDDHKKQKQRDSQLDARVKNADELYVFDANSRIYQPKGTQSQERRNTDQRGKDWKSALRVYPAGDGCMLSLGAFGAAISFATLIVVALYTYYASGQWDEMRKAAMAAKKSAEIADATLKSTEKSFVVNQRPFLVLDEGSPNWVQGQEPKPDGKIAVHIQFRNIGRTAAIQEITNLDFFSRREEPKASGALAQKKAQTEAIAFMTKKFAELRAADHITRKEIKGLLKYSAGQDVAPNRTYFTSTKQTVTIPGDQFPLLGTGDIALYLIGHVSYTDSFDQAIYQTEFCYYYFGSVLITWHLCDHHNTIR
jgi:hypothetical protein